MWQKKATFPLFAKHFKYCLHVVAIHILPKLHGYCLWCLIYSLLSWMVYMQSIVIHTVLPLVSLNPQGYSSWTPYTPCVRYTLNLPHRDVWHVRMMVIIFIPYIIVNRNNQLLQKNKLILTPLMSYTKSMWDTRLQRWNWN